MAMEFMVLVLFSTRVINLHSQFRAFPGGSVLENLPASAGDTGSIPGLGRSHKPRSSEASVCHNY